MTFTPIWTAISDQLYPSGTPIEVFDLKNGDRYVTNDADLLPYSNKWTHWRLIDLPALPTPPPPLTDEELALVIWRHQGIDFALTRMDQLRDHGPWHTWLNGCLAGLSANRDELQRTGRQTLAQR